MRKTAEEILQDNLNLYRVDRLPDNAKDGILQAMEEYHSLKQKEEIKLPSDAELFKAMEECAENSRLAGKRSKSAIRYGFSNCAKWMSELIKNKINT